MIDLRSENHKLDSEIAQAVFVCDSDEKQQIIPRIKKSKNSLKHDLELVANLWLFFATIESMIHRIL